MPNKDLTNVRFGKLLVLEKSHCRDSKGRIQWVCVCDCNSTKEVIKTGKYLLNGDTKSCGCLRNDKLIKRNQTVNKNVNKKYNIYNIHGEYGIGWTEGGYEFYFDLEDYDLIKNYYWEKDQDGYLRAYNPTRIPKHIMMHSLLLRCKGGYVPDHINNKNKNDNRKLNLRRATLSQNSMNNSISSRNKSGFIGVFYNNKSNKWSATIYINKKQKYLGLFNTLYDAVVARLKAEKTYYKEFSPQLHLFKEYLID